MSEMKWTSAGHSQLWAFVNNIFITAVFSSYGSSALFPVMASPAVFLQSSLWLATACQFLVLTNMAAFKYYDWQNVTPCNLADAPSDLEGGDSTSLQYVLLNYQTINIFTAHSSIFLLFTVTRPSNLT
jgi:hypothetical protein